MKTPFIGTKGLIAGLAVTPLFVLGIASPNRAQAQSYTSFQLLHSFGGGTDGANPYAGVMVDTLGNLYGTTFFGGTYGSGTVFKVSPAGAETVLYNFTGGADGSGPEAGLAMDPTGNLYGTTTYGGAVATCQPPSGCGTVFEIETTSKEIVLYSFTDGADGGFPLAGLVLDTAGNLYGTARGGSPSDFEGGSVFKISSAGKESVLYTFTNGLEGGVPEAGLIMDTAGNLYGTTAYDGACAECGTVFKIEPAGNLTVLYSFVGYPGDGAVPQGNLLLDSLGNLYGTTNLGGVNGSGTVFKITPAGKESVLYSFGATGAGDGQRPTGNLVRDNQGNLYGTTWLGGGGAGGYQAGNGTVFELVPTGKESILYRFPYNSAGNYCTESPNGAQPVGGLASDSLGNLYGTTTIGGITTSCTDGGTLFELSSAPATTTTLTASPTPSVYGQTVTFLAGVTSTAGTPPNGETVSFTSGSTALGSAKLASGAATFSTSILAVGSNPVSAAYAGDANFSSSTKSVNQVVDADGTTTTLNPSVNPAALGQAVTLTATVKAPYGPIPTGTVTFKNGAAVLGVVTLNAGIATFTTSGLPLGASSISASYSGAKADAASVSSALAETILPGSTMTLTSSPNPSVFDGAVTFTATVKASSGAVPTGTVAFKNGSMAIGTVTLSSGVASFTSSALSGGEDSITAAYSGSAADAASVSPVLIQTVVSSTTTTVTSSGTPSAYGQTVTFTATVKAVSGPFPAGTVSFQHGNGIVIGTAPVVGGVATFSTSTLLPAKYFVTASYSGSSTDSLSVSPALIQTVLPATTTKVVSSTNPSVLDQAVTFTATVTPSSGGTPTGTVTFQDGDVLIGTVTLASGAAKVTSTTFIVGSHKLTAVYNNSTADAASTSAVLVQVVDQ